MSDTKNTPTEIELTPENHLDMLMFWLPDQLHEMRTYAAGDIVIRRGDSVFSIVCTYFQTIYGERFRIVDRNPYGDTVSDYFLPLGQDDDIILGIAQRIQPMIESHRRYRQHWTDQNAPKIIMTFELGPFEAAVAALESAAGR